MELLKLRRERLAAKTGEAATFEPSLLELTPADVLHSRLSQETLSDELSNRLTQLHQQALDTVLQSERAEADA